MATITNTCLPHYTITNTWHISYSLRLTLSPRSIWWSVETIERLSSEHSSLSHSPSNYSRLLIYVVRAILWRHASLTGPYRYYTSKAGGRYSRLRAEWIMSPEWSSHWRTRFYNEQLFSASLSIAHEYVTPHHAHVIRRLCRTTAFAKSKTGRRVLVDGCYDAGEQQRRGTFAKLGLRREGGHIRRQRTRLDVLFEPIRLAKLAWQAAIPCRAAALPLLHRVQGVSTAHRTVHLLLHRRQVSTEQRRLLPNGELARDGLSGERNEPPRWLASGCHPRRLLQLAVLSEPREEHPGPLHHAPHMLIYRRVGKKVRPDPAMPRRRHERTRLSDRDLRKGADNLSIHRQHPRRTRRVAHDFAQLRLRVPLGGVAQR